MTVYDLPTTPTSTATSTVHDSVSHDDHIDNNITIQSTKGEGTSSSSPVLKIPENMHPPVDIEHVPVQDDPREWPKRRKVSLLYASQILTSDTDTTQFKLFTLGIVACAALIATLGVNIYNRE